MFSDRDAGVDYGDIRSTLEKIYRRLPDTVCEECGRCCSFRAGMRYVEYRSVRSFIDRTWTVGEREALRAMVLKHRRLRMVYAELPAGTPFRFYKPHCLLYDEHKHRCTVYALRPLDCRLHGLGGECDKVRLAQDPKVAAASAVSREDLYRVTAELGQVNVSVTDPSTGKIVGQNQPMPVEFWFVLHESGWDPTLDPDDKLYFARSVDASHRHRSRR